MSVYDAASEEKRKIVLEKLAALSYPKKYEPPFTEMPFGEICGVWADFAMGELQAKAGRLLNLLSPKAKEKLKEKLQAQLSDRAAPSLAALLHLAKMENRLEGKTPKERYLFFIEKMFPQPQYIKEVFFHFPPLARFISAQILLWIDQAIEFLTRFQKDLAELGVGMIEDLSLSLSDLHHGNRSVYQLDFEGSSLIYKPKPLSLDKAYNEFLEKLNPLGLNPKLKTYRIIDKGEYGWVEFVKTLPCETNEEVKRYFQRLGMLISLMFILEGTDCHYENIICSGEDPVLIDLESLFHPTLRISSDIPELSVWNHSVFRTGFLPSFGLAAQRRMDISPLSAEEEQETPQEVAKWDKVNTDEMKFIFVKKKLSIHVPRPKFNGKIVSTTNYIEDLLSGFKTMYLLFSSKKVLSILEPLFHYPVRCIFRPTSLYFRILQRLTDPKLMRSDAEVDKTLEILMRFSNIKENPDLRIIVNKEKEALLFGDIPFFLSSPTDSHIYLGKKILAKNCFKEPAKQKVIEKIETLDEKDMLRQMEYMDQSLYYLRMTDKAETYKYQPFNPQEKVRVLKEEEIFHAAEEIGHKMIEQSLPLSDGSLAWITLELDPSIERYIFQPLSSSFYSGYAGVALFFVALGKLLKKPIFIEQAERILERQMKPFHDDPEALLLLSNLGGMAGLGGTIYSLSQIGKMLGKEKYLKDASTIASLVDQKKIQEDVNLDLILGAAGFLLALLAHYETTKEPSLLEKAKETGRFLIEKGKKMGRGIAWETLGGKALCGMSHGVAGISWSLFRLAKVSKDPSFAKTAEESLLYERGLYSPEKENWPDLRKDQEQANPYSWCHGAPGIGLSRLYANQLYPDPEKEKEIELALKVTQQHLVGSIDHLCCGNFSRLALFWDAGKLLQREALKEMVMRETAVILKGFQEKGTFRLFHKLPEKIQSPCFMQGLSGIGYFLLRLTKIGKDLPEILVMDN